MTGPDRPGLGVSPAFALAQLDGEWPALDADPAEVAARVEKLTRKRVAAYGFSPTASRPLALTEPPLVVLLSRPTVNRQKETEMGQVSMSLNLPTKTWSGALTYLRSHGARRDGRVSSGEVRIVAADMLAYVACYVCATAEDQKVMMEAYMGAARHAVFAVPGASIRKIIDEVNLEKVEALALAMEVDEGPSC